MAQTKSEPLAKVSGRAMARGTRAKAERGARVKAETEIGTLRPHKQQNAPANAATTAARSETITAEASDYSKKSVENGFAFFEELLGAKSFENVAHIGSEYAKTSYVNFAAYLTKIGELYTHFAKDAFGELPHLG